MRRYILKIKENPLHTEAKYLSIYNPFSIVSRSKDEEALLKYADIAAHAVYQCANKSETNFSIPEPRYLKELSRRFGVDNKGKVLGTGIKCIHSLSDLQLDPEIETFLDQLRGAPQPAKA